MSREERIHVAVVNWAPRFVANGVDFNYLYRPQQSDWLRPMLHR